MRHSSVLPTRLLHAQEMLEYVLSDEKMINALTRNTKEIFYDTLEASRTRNVRVCALR